MLNMMAIKTKLSRVCLLTKLSHHAFFEISEKRGQRLPTLSMSQAHCLQSEAAEDVRKD